MEFREVVDAVRETIADQVKNGRPTDFEMIRERLEADISPLELARAVRFLENSGYIRAQYTLR